MKFKVRSTHSPTFNDFRMNQADYDEYVLGDRKRTELEELYFDFCKKAYSKIVTHSCFNGGFHPEGIVFPDFTFEVIPQTIRVE